VEQDSGKDLYLLRKLSVVQEISRNSLFCCAGSVVCFVIHSCGPRLHVEHADRYDFVVTSRHVPREQGLSI
jgi:hypothetical protein